MRTWLYARRDPHSCRPDPFDVMDAISRIEINGTW
jgi:hypothetical protein